ncbi:MAG TPA: hypothetical protein VMX15_02270, partial [Candidatus Heimdallarchaeota archaeon]|nr:hypothetical protein [Candidatus Heimdallarchaeota archaeon]
WLALFITMPPHHAAFEAAAFLSPPFRVGHANAIPRQAKRKGRKGINLMTETNSHLKKGGFIEIIVQNLDKGRGQSV